MNGVLIIDKPAGLTSHDVVNRARRILHERSIGHLGTLDPMATGVLPLVTGSLTRLAQFYTHAEKSYEGTIRFGFATDTYDAEGEPTTAPQPVTLKQEEVEALAARFRGVIEQTPPPFSAKKINGVPAYKLARKQKEVVLKPVQVEIREFEILGIGVGRTLLSAAVDPALESDLDLDSEPGVLDRTPAALETGDRVHFRARVASGTYMRSVAHEMGRLLGCGAHLESLRRTAVAEFTLADAHTLDELSRLVNDCHPDRSFALPKGKGSAVEGPAVVAAATPSPGGTDDNAALTSPVEAPENSPPVLLAGNLQTNEPRPVGTPEPQPVTLDSFFVHPRKLLSLIHI